MSRWKYQELTDNGRRYRHSVRLCIRADYTHNIVTILKWITENYTMDDYFLVESNLRHIWFASEESALMFLMRWNGE